MNKTIKGNKKDADTYLNETLAKISAGSVVEPVKLTVNEYLDQWLENAARPRVRERTFLDYQDKINRYLRPVLGEHRFCDLHPLDIQKLYGEMQARGLSARTIRYAHAILASAFKQAMKWRMLSRNPCEAVELPRIIRQEMRSLSLEEAKRFLNHASEDEQGIVFSFALATGMRPEEYLALKWEDIDLEKGNATVQRTLVRAKGGGWYFGEPKTPRSRRTVPLPRSLLRLLLGHRRIQVKTRLKAGPAYQNPDLVFATPEGTPHNLRNLTQRHFQPILTRAGLARIRVYDLRHSCATLLLAAGENPKVVSERLGHASIVLTLDTYSHVLPSMQQAATEKLETILFANTGT